MSWSQCGRSSFRKSEYWVCSSDASHYQRGTTVPRKPHQPFRRLRWDSTINIHYLSSFHRKSRRYWGIYSRHSGFKAVVIWPDDYIWLQCELTEVFSRATLTRIGFRDSSRPLSHVFSLHTSVPIPEFRKNTPGSRARYAWCNYLTCPSPNGLAVQDNSYSIWGFWGLKTLYMCIRVVFYAPGATIIDELGDCETSLVTVSCHRSFHHFPGSYFYISLPWSLFDYSLLNRYPMTALWYEPKSKGKDSTITFLVRHSGPLTSLRFKEGERLLIDGVYG